MGVKKIVIKIQKNLDKLIGKEDAATHEKVLAVLKMLQKLDIDFRILTTTKIVLTVNDLRKSSENGEVKRLGKIIMLKWKRLVAENREDESCTKLPHLADEEVRPRARQMLCNALQAGPSPPEDCPSLEEMAAALEEAIYNEFNNMSNKYRNRIRSRAANLKDPKNPSLRNKFLCGAISATQLARMTPQEMASPEMKKLREKYLEDSFEQANWITNSGSQTSLLKCERCKKYNCSYNQLQTRSSDESMTTFVLCNECGLRWKFS